MNFIVIGFSDDLFDISFSQIMRCAFNGWIRDSFNVWNNILNYFFTFSKTLFGFFFKGHHLSVMLEFIFFCFPHLWFFLPLLSSGFYISFFLLPTPLFWAMLIHSFKECILNAIPRQVLFYHSPDSIPAFMVINFNKGGRSRATNTWFKLRSINSIKTNETGYRHGEWQGISPERMVKKASLRWWRAEKPGLRGHLSFPVTHSRPYIEQVPLAKKATTMHSEVQPASWRG